MGPQQAVKPPNLRSRLLIVAWEVVGLSIGTLAWTGVSVWLGRVSLGGSGAGWFYLILGATGLLVGMEAIALSRQVGASPTAP